MAESERPPGCDSPKPGGVFWQLLSADGTFRLPEAMIFVGSADCDVLVKAKSVDKRHAVIMYDYCDKKFKVKDLNSANGTFVNEARIPVQTYIQLESMDVLRFGFDSAIYQVVRVPDARDLPVPQPHNELFIKEPGDIISTNITLKQGSRAHVQEQKSPVENNQHPTTDLKMTGAISSSSLQSAFSEDSLLGVNEGAAPSVTTEVPSPLEEASTPSSSGSTEPASSEKPSTSSSPTSSHKPSGDDETLAASLSDVAQPPSSATSSPEKQPPPPSPSTYPLAFTIDFNDGKKLDIGDSISKFAPRHIRNLSLSRQEEAKSLKQEKEGKSEMEVKKPSPPALSPTVQPAAVPMLRRAGYHSEGYFSSDQDEDLSIKSDLTALKKNQEKILKPSTLTQDKKSKPVSSLAIESNSPNSRRPLAGERRTISLEESASQHFAKILAEKASIPTKSPEKEVIETLSDNGSETGTYTIDKESPSPDEEKARSDIDAVFGVGEDEARGGYDNRTFTRNKEMKNGHEEHTVLSSSYRAGPNWIKEWAAQVAEQHNTQPLSPPNEPVLPSIKSKGRATSPLRGTKPSPRASPAPPSRNWPPPTEPSASAKARYKLPSLSSPVASDFSDPSESPVHKRNVERPVDNETESYLRTTESVMSAMQARMTSQTLDNADSEEEAGLSSGAVTAKSLTAQLRAKLKALEQKSVRSKHHAAIAAAVAKAPSPPPVAPAPTSAALKRVTGTKSKDERQSDSSSDAGDHKPRSRERSDSVGPHTSLRRARLEADEAKTKALQQPPKPALVKPSPPAAVSKLKKEPPKTVSKPPLSSSNFQRTDGGRFSLRAGKANTQIPSSSAPKGKPPANAGKKEPAKKTNSSGGNRSNSNLCSKELEFQNWKRRKNYDPMKAAAEGKKKAAAAAKPVNPNQGGDIMTQSAIVMTHSSPNASPLNSILRSASFHGTGAMASMNSSHGSNATSEDEATLSADEELAEKSNSSVSPRHLRQFPSSPLRAVSQPPDHLSPRKKSLDETLEGGSSRGFVRNTTPTSSVRSRGKFEALDNLVIAAIHGFSNKIKGSSHNVLGKLRVLFQEDQEKVLMLEDALNLLEESEPATTSPNKSPSKELSGTLRNLKKLEHVFNVLDEVLFGDEDLELRDDDDLSELEEA